MFVEQGHVGMFSSPMESLGYVSPHTCLSKWFSPVSGGARGFPQAKPTFWIVERVSLLPKEFGGVAL